MTSLELPPQSLHRQQTTRLLSASVWKSHSRAQRIVIDSCALLMGYSFSLFIKRPIYPQIYELYLWRHCSVHSYILPCHLSSLLIMQNALLYIY